MLVFLLIGLFALGDTVLGLASQSPNQILSSPGYTLPQLDPNPSLRAQEVAINHAGFLYGPPLIGNSSFFPAGKLGNQRVGTDVIAFQRNAAFITQSIEKESVAVVEKITKVLYIHLVVAIALTNHAKAGGFKNLSSYELLYKEEWNQSNPIGIAPGYFINYTQDLHFSMERLSINPFSTSRLHPNDTLPFTVDDATVLKIAGVSLGNLHGTGRLFLASHSYQVRYKLQPGRFAAACDAYFYLHPKTNEFLPLVIKTNVGSNLTYTPFDSANDWLFAKMISNSNDFLHSQIFHLANSHAVAEIVYLAALRTLSARHPVRAFLDRSKFNSYLQLVTHR